MLKSSLVRVAKMMDAENIDATPILQVGGGNKVLGALQAGAITTALPFTIVLLLCCVSLYRGLRHELDSLLNRAANNG